MSKHHGQFFWYDLMTTDCKAAETFYRSVMGWDAKDSGVPGQTYTLLSKGAAMVGGLMPIPQEARAMGARPCWTGYIAVDDVDAYVDRVKAAGGSLIRGPVDVPGMLRFAVVADPHGAPFIIFRGFSEEAPPPVAPGTPGHVGWHELQAGDREADFAFYAGLFGWTKGEAIESPAGPYQLFATGGAPVGGVMTKMPEAPGPFWLYYVNVENVDGALTRVKKGGGQVCYGPMQVPGGSWIAQCIDPQGAMFAVAGSKA
jgi:predicted enzyme related to lactoylglutathione lyase